VWKQFRYQPFQVAPNASFPNGYIARRPMLDFELISGTTRIDCRAIVDSGADYCCFPLSWALRLGFDPTNKSAGRFGGAGAPSVEIFHWDVNLSFGGRDLPIYAGFTDGLEPDGPGILGQNGFFDQYPILFDHARNCFYLYSES
jgi:hypothetical protein